MKIFEIVDTLYEMAMPSDIHRSMTYYHGTTDAKAAKSIMKNGIQPRSVTLAKRDSRTRVNLNPVEGKVYITPNLGYAQMYALGGDVAGSNYQPKDRKYGFMAVIDGKEIKDIQPDEDSVGEIIYNAMRENSLDPFLIRMANTVRASLTPNQLRQFRDGEYDMWAHTGKKLLKKMSDSDKLRFIDFGAHIAHEGALIPSAMWRIDLKYIPNLKKDGSNFFEFAKQIG